MERLLTLPATGWGSMDELAAAAAVVTMSVNGYAEAGFKQRPPCGDADGREGQGLPVEGTEADKENNGGVSASGDVEDAKEQVYFASKVPLGTLWACSTSRAVMARSRTL